MEEQIQKDRASKTISGETCSICQEMFWKVAALKNFGIFQAKNLLNWSYYLPLEETFPPDQYLQENETLRTIGVRARDLQKSFDNIIILLTNLLNFRIFLLCVIRWSVLQK